MKKRRMILGLVVQHGWNYTCVRDGCCWWDMKDHVDAGVDRYGEVCSRYVFVERNLEGESVKVL